LQAKRICIATSSSSAYYSLASKLKKAGVEFVSVVPGSDCSSCEIVLTTSEEAAAYGARAMSLEGLDQDPFVLKGQILSRLSGGEETLLFGVDPGTRIGLAAFYGEEILRFATFDSVQALVACVSAFVERVKSKESVVRVGNGDRALAAILARVLLIRVPEVRVEMVDEAGTSSRDVGMRGVQGDQRAAAKIAYRKGVSFKAPSRTRQ
jgi:hypothetical protein